MSVLEKLSIVIPTYDRHDFVRRQISYWSSSPVTIHIVDGSPDPLSKKDLENLTYIMKKNQGLKFDDGDDSLLMVS